MTTLLVHDQAEPDTDRVALAANAAHPGPGTYLDKAIVRLALARARELMAQGHSAEDAATLACTGAWHEWRAYVLARLTDRS